MREPLTDDETRVLPLVTNHLMLSYADAVAALGTTDLVLDLVVARGVVRAHARSDFEARLRAHVGDRGDNNQSLALLSQPAASQATLPLGPLAFWYIVAFPDRHVACIAISGLRLSVQEVTGVA